MTRFNILDRADMSEEQRRLSDNIEATDGILGGPYWAYIRNPAYLRLHHEMRTYLRNTPLTDRERQLAVLVAVRFWDAEFSWVAQARAAPGARHQPGHHRCDRRTAAAAARRCQGEGGIRRGDRAAVYPPRKRRDLCLGRGTVRARSTDRLGGYDRLLFIGRYDRQRVRHHAAGRYNGQATRPVSQFARPELGLTVCRQGSYSQTITSSQGGTDNEKIAGNRVRRNRFGCGRLFEYHRDGRRSIAQAGFDVAQKHPVGRAFKGFIDRTNEEFKGQFRIDWRGGPEVVPQFKQPNAVRIGSVDMTITSPSYANGILSVSGAANYSNKPYEEISGSGYLEYMTTLHKEKNLVYVAELPVSDLRFHIYFRTPIKSITDIKNKKIRVFPAIAPAITALGGSPLVLQMGEIFTAMERGIVDGFAQGTMGVGRQFKGVAKAYLAPGMYRATFHVLANRNPGQSSRPVCGARSPDTPAQSGRPSSRRVGPNR